MFVFSNNVLVFKKNKEIGLLYVRRNKIVTAHTLNAQTYFPY